MDRVYRGFLFLVILLVALSSIAVAQTSETCSVAGYEGDRIVLNVDAYDPDPEIGPAGRLIWEFSSPFDDRGVWQTLKGMRGIFDFWVSVSDGELKDVKNDCVELFPNNRDPILEPVPEVYITRGDNTRIDATCHDPDGDPVTINYRFDGKDVMYILYEPPGTYNLDITCTDGFGGVDSYRTKIHIDMPPPPEPEPKPAPVIYEEPEPDHQPVVMAEEPQPVELHLPEEIVCPPVEPDVIEVVTPKEDVCDPDPEVIEVVHYREPVCDPRPEVVEVVHTKEVVCDPRPEVVEVVHTKEVVCDPRPEVVEVVHTKESSACPDPEKPEPDVVEITYQQPCERVYDIDVVMYDTLQEIDTTSADSEMFELEQSDRPGDDSAEEEPDYCHEDIERKMEISEVMGCCG